MTDSDVPTPAGHAEPQRYPLLSGHPLRLAADLSGRWAYQIDTGADPALIVYGPGPWPFYRAGKPTWVRLSPDIACRDWSQHYVHAGPDDSGLIGLRMHIDDDAAPGRALVPARLDLTARHVVLPTELPEHLRWQVKAKATRVLALVDAATADRRVHVRPVTAGMRLAAAANRRAD